jgi:dGTPase
MAMDWNLLLSTERLGRGKETSQDARSEFQRDYDRIVYSSAFRRLQDKTQVFPLAESDYVRTRLTHSIEVSCVGRSLGTLVGSYVIERENLKGLNFHPQDFGNIVAAACLAHDIGNPPFGHSGEEAIRAWFEEKGTSYLEGLPQDQAQDFRRFEGNAQGFRVLSRLQNKVDGGGMQLTFAVLAAFSKYPRRAYVPALDGSKKVSEKKFGFVVGDEEWFSKVAKGTGLREKLDGAWSRHPLAFLMEAADDICYRIVDLEDGHRLRCVSFKETEDLLRPLAFKPGEDITKGSYGEISAKNGRVEYLRARAINALIEDVVNVFKDNYEQIMKGDFEEDLMSKSKYHKELEDIKTLSRKEVYSFPDVLQIEAAGFEVLGGLLGKIVPALVKDEAALGAGEKKVRELVSPQFKLGITPYQRLLGATDYVSGMTDSYALMLYRRLLGIELPGGQ